MVSGGTVCCCPSLSNFAPGRSAPFLSRHISSKLSSLVSASRPLI